MASFGEIQTATKLRDVVTSIAVTTVDKLRPAEKIGKVYSVDYERSVAKIWFAGESIDSLIEARFAADKIPTEAMITTFSTAGYDATGNIVRVAGGPGSYYILDYVSGIPAIDPSARALVINNTTIIKDSVDQVGGQVDAVEGQLVILDGALAQAQIDLNILNSYDLPALATALGENQEDVDALNNVTIPALNSRLAEAEGDLTTLGTDIGSLEGLFPITSTSISDGAITTPKITVGTLDGDRILTNTLQAAKIVAGSITTDRFTSNTIDGSVITANTLNASKIVAGSIATDRMTANTINGDRITANTLNASKIVAGSITTDRMTANTINGDRILVNTLHGDKILANTITAGKLNVFAGGDNLFRNSSWDSVSYMDYWGKYDNSAVAAVSSVASGRRTGKSARLTWTATGAIVGFYQSPPGGFKAGQEYTLSFYARSQATNSSGATMAVASNAPAIIGTWMENPPLSGAWARYVFTFTRASDTTDAVYFGVTSGWGTAGQTKIVDFDDAQLEEGNLATAWKPKTDEILPGTISAGMVTADAINGMTITGVNITGTSTITGGTIRTAGSGNRRVEMNSAYTDSLNWFNPSNTRIGYISVADTSMAFASSSNVFYFFGTSGASGVLNAGVLDLGGYWSAWGEQRMYNSNTSNFAYLGVTGNGISSGTARIYYNNINRQVALNGSGVYSTEGSFTVGCEFYGNFIGWSDLKDKSDLKPVGKSKDNVRKIAPSADSALDVVRKLTVYDYDTKHGGAGKGPNKANKLVRKRGIVAQDLQKVAPHLIHDETDDPNTGFGMGIDLYGFSATTLAGLQELDEEVEALKKRLEQLEKRN